MRLYVCIWIPAFSIEFMPKDLEKVGGDGPAATHGVCIVSMMGPCLEPHVPSHVPWCVHCVHDVPMLGASKTCYDRGGRRPPRIYGPYTGKYWSFAMASIGH